jgi:hypothetical protein
MTSRWSAGPRQAGIREDVRAEPQVRERSVRPVQAVSVVDQVIKEIRRSILAGAPRPGQEFSLHGIADDLGVSAFRNRDPGAVSASGLHHLDANEHSPSGPSSEPNRWARHAVLPSSRVAAGRRGGAGGGSAPGGGDVMLGRPGCRVQLGPQKRPAFRSGQVRRVARTVSVAVRVPGRENSRGHGHIAGGIRAPERSVCTVGRLRTATDGPRQRRVSA